MGDISRVERIFKRMEQAAVEVLHWAADSMFFFFNGGLLKIKIQWAEKP